MCTEAACGCHCGPRVPRVLAGVPRDRCISSGQGRTPGLARAELICRPQHRRALCVPQIRALMAIPAEPLGAAPSLQKASNFEMAGQAGGLRPGALLSPIFISFLGPRLCGRHRTLPREQPRQGRAEATHRPQGCSGAAEGSWAGGSRGLCG